MARTAGNVRVLAGADEHIQSITPPNGFQAIHDFKTHRGWQRSYPAVAGVDRHGLAASEDAQKLAHQLPVFDVPSQRSDHRWTQEEDTGGNGAYANARQRREKPFQTFLIVRHAGQDRVEPSLDQDACVDQFVGLRGPNVWGAANGSNAAATAVSSVIIPMRPP